MNAYKVLIVEDDVVSSLILEQLLCEHENITLIGTAINIDSAQNLILKHRPDLVFLDICLDNENGIEMYLNILPFIDWTMYVVLNSSYRSIIADAKKLPFFDILIKPINNSEFSLVMNRFYRYNELNCECNSKTYTLSQLFSASLTVRINTIAGFKILKVNEIKYMEYIPQKNYKRWNIQMVSGEKIPLKGTVYIKAFLKYSSVFSQINQHQIININYFTDFEPDNQFLLQKPFEEPGKSFIVSRAFLRKIRKQYKRI
jgi:two-component system LytT family response regulator